MGGWLASVPRSIAALCSRSFVRPSHRIGLVLAISRSCHSASPHPDTFLSALRDRLSAKDSSGFRGVMTSMVQHGSSPGRVIFHLWLRLCVVLRCEASAVAVWHHMHMLDIKPTPTSHRLLLELYSKTGNHVAALHALRSFVSSGGRLFATQCHPVLHRCVQLAAWQDARAVLDLLNTASVPYDHHMLCLALQVYARCGDVDGAAKLVRVMAKTGVNPPFGSLDVLPATHIDQGDIVGLARAMRVLQDGSFRLSPHTATRVLLALARHNSPLLLRHATHLLGNRPSPHTIQLVALELASSSHLSTLELWCEQYPLTDPSLLDFVQSCVSGDACAQRLSDVLRHSDLDALTPALHSLVRSGQTLATLAAAQSLLAHGVSASDVFPRIVHLAKRDGTPELCQALEDAIEPHQLPLSKELFVARCTALAREGRGAELDEYARSRSLPVSRPVVLLLIDVHSRTRNLVGLRQVCHSVQQYHTRPSKAVLNHLFKSLTDAGALPESVSLLQARDALKWSPPVILTHSLITRLAQAGDSEGILAVIRAAEPLPFNPALVDTLLKQESPDVLEVAQGIVSKLVDEHGVAALFVPQKSNAADVRTLETLISTGELAQAGRLESELQARGVSNRAAFEARIKLHLALNDHSGVWKLWEAVCAAKIKPSGAVYHSVLQSCLASKDVQSALRVLVDGHGMERQLNRDVAVQLLKEFSSNGTDPELDQLVSLTQHMVPDPQSVFFEFLCGCAKQQNVTSLLRTVRAMQREGRGVGAVTWTALLDILARRGHPGAMTVFHQMRREGVDPGLRGYTVMLKYCAQSDPVCTDEAKQLFTELERSGLSPDSVAYTAYMHVFVCACDEAGALGVWNRMRDAGCMADAVAYSSLLRLYMALGRADRLHELVQSAQREGVVLDYPAYVSLLVFYSRRGDRDGLDRTLTHMQMARVRCGWEVYSARIELALKANDPAQVSAVLREMVGVCFPPSAPIVAQLQQYLDAPVTEGERIVDWHRVVCSHV